MIRSPLLMVAAMAAIATATFSGVNTTVHVPTPPPDKTKEDLERIEKARAKAMRKGWKIPLSASL